MLAARFAQADEAWRSGPEVDVGGFGPRGLPPSDLTTAVPPRLVIAPEREQRPGFRPMQSKSTNQGVVHF